MVPPTWTSPKYFDFCHPVPFDEIDGTRALQKSGLAFPVDDDPEMFRRAHLLKSHIPGKQALDRTDAGSKAYCISVVARLFQLLAAGNRSRENGRVDHRRVHSGPRRLQLVHSLYLHLAEEAAPCIALAVYTWARCRR